MSYYTKHSNRVYITLAGPTDNLGDALIRRHSLSWARGDSSAPLEVYGGKASDEWLDLMGVRKTDKVTRRRSQWILKVVTSPRKAAYFFEPGELRLGMHMLTKELVGFSITTWIRLRGGLVVHPPRAVSKPNRLVLGIHKLSAALAQVNLWRQEESRTIVGRGRTVPDIAFSEASYGQSKAAEKSSIVVSLRDNRPDPGQAFVDALRELAASENLDLVTVAQVEEDEERAQDLALRINGNHVAWADTHAKHELTLRGIYGNAALVISDRLHVLVLAALGGASPVEAVPEPSGKIKTHFATAGIYGISHNISAMSTDAILSTLRSLLHADPELHIKLSKARNTLINERHKINQTKRFTF